MNENKVLTMKDIAKEFGISIATVSRALSNSSIISREKREMIQRYAQEHNFTPNIIAKDLRNTKIEGEDIRSSSDRVMSAMKRRLSYAVRLTKVVSQESSYR